MINDMTATEVLNAGIDRLLNEAADRGRAEQRALGFEQKVWEKNDEIAALKSKLAKYENVPGQPIAVPPFAVQTTDYKLSLVNQMIEQAQSGNKINAIKLCRELTGAGLKEAKDCIINGFGEIAPIADGANAKVKSVETLIKLVKNSPSEKINIIREVRSLCGIGLKEAKDAVEFSMSGSWDSTYLGAGMYQKRW